MRICFRFCFILIFAVFYSCSLLFGAKANLSHIILLDNNARGLPVANTLMHVEALRVGNKVYLAWQGGPYLNPYVAYFDEETGQMSAVTEAGTNPLYDPPYKDNNHGEPAICMDTLGYIHVLYGSHSSRQLHSRSSQPYNITSFIQLPDISDYSSYPKLILADNGRIYHFYRGEGLWRGTVLTMKYSDDNGETFSDPIILVNGFDGDFEDKLYTGGADYNKEHNRIWFAWVFFDYSEMLNRNVYLGYLDLTTHHFFTYASEDLGSMINRATMDEKCMIYNSESNNTQFGSLRLTPEGEPIVFSTLGASLFGEGSYVSFHMVNGVMVMKDMGVKTGNMETTWGDMIVYGKDNIEAYVPTGGNITGADAIERLRYDGEWHKEVIVFQKQTNPLTTLQCVRGDKPTTQTVAKMIFGEGYDSDMLPDTKDVPVNVYFYYEEQAIPEFSSEAVLLSLVAYIALIFFLTKKKEEQPQRNL